MRVAQASDHADLVTAGSGLRAQRAPLRLSVFDAQGRTRGRRRRARPGPRRRRGAGELAPRGCRPRLRPGRKDRAAGQARRNLGGTTTRSGTDAPARDASTDPLYVSVPFVLVLREGRAHGVFLDNAWRSHSRRRPRRARPGCRSVPRAAASMFYVIDGPDPKAVIERWAPRFTGRTSPLPPRWALGYQQSRWSYTPEARVRRSAETFRARRVPAGRPCGWTSTTSRTPQALHLGRRVFSCAGPAARRPPRRFHVVTIVDPHPPREPGYALYDAGLAGGHFVRRAPTAACSAARCGPAGGPARGRQRVPRLHPCRHARRWGEGTALPRSRRGRHLERHERAGGVGYARRHSARRRAPRQRRRAHRPPCRAQRLRHAVQPRHLRGSAASAPGRAPFVLTRASFAGGQRYAAVWTGDNTADWPRCASPCPC